MLPELGQFLLVVASVFALFQGVTPWLKAGKPSPAGQLAAGLAVGQFLAVAGAFLVLVACFVLNDFSVRYVAQNSNSLLPVWYRISAVWGGHEGSLLLWVLILAGWTLAVALVGRRTLAPALLKHILGVMGLLAAGFYGFILFTSNPFDRLLPFFPLNGQDLNPLLQDPGLIFHPPMLYMGYVGFSVAYAFAIAGLISGRLDSAWARWARPWTTVAWCFLTLGIALGSWWAYYELGWGGWWFWDPVENASLMPWLAGTALLHSLAVTEKRGAFKAWTVMLAILAFSLSLLGTFLVRSGVLNSVHAFASDPTRGLFILAFLVLVVGGSLLLFTLRGHLLQSHSRYQGLSKETLLLGNNLLLMFMLLVVLLGTLSPLIAEAMDKKISVRAPYFNLYFVPATLLLMLLLTPGVLAQWKKQDARVLLQQLWLPGLAAVIAGVSLHFLLFDQWYWQSLAASVLVGWVIAGMARDLAGKIRHQASFWQGLKSLRRAWLGMSLAHLGLVVTVVGVTCTSLFDIERDVKMALGEAVEVGNYRFSMQTIREVEGENYHATVADILVEDLESGREIAHLIPQKRIYTVGRRPMTEAAIDAGFTRDLYIALGEPLSDNAWAVRVYYKPFIRWIWFGALIMALGGALAISDRRYRFKAKA